MVRGLTVVACAIGLGVAIWLSPGQTKTPDNQTSTQANERRNPPSQQSQPVTTNQALDTSPNQPVAAKEKSYRQQFVEHLATDPIVWLTIALAFLASVQLRVYFAEVEDTRSIERAYIGVRATPPGLDSNAVVSFRITNAGNTPATVTHVYLNARLATDMESVPEVPDYSAHRRTEAKDGQQRSFLVKDDFFHVALQGQQRHLLEAQKAPLVLYVYGFVDYIDKFKTRHRCGFGRYYAPQRDAREGYSSDVKFAERSNLPHLPKPRYHYDRIRKAGEGLDWNEKV